MRKGWTLAKGRAAYRYELFEHFKYIRMEWQLNKKRFGSSERWRAFLAGMEAALGLTQRDIRRIRAEARRQARQALATMWFEQKGRP